MKGSLQSFIKFLLFGRRERFFRVKSGPAKGLNFLIDPGNNSQRIFGLAEREIFKPLRRLAISSRTFIDIGASDGFYPITVASINQNAEIIGCEPRAEMKQRFEDNLRHNDIHLPSRVEWINDFVGSERVPLGKLLEKSSAPVLVKIDVDGAEEEVLLSGKEELRNRDCAVILEIHSLDLEKRCAALLSELGFSTTVINQRWWRMLIPEQRPIPHNRWLIAEKRGRKITGARS
jgi:precorrin-6B methylase 2